MGRSALLLVASLLSCCSLHVSLRLSPDQSQFFRGDAVSLSCEDSSGDWTVRRNTSRDTRGRCGVDWGTDRGSLCKITRLYPWDSGTYWCESREIQTSDSVIISVKEKDVVLQTSVLPVTKRLKASPASTADAPPPTTEAPPPASERPLALALLCHLVVLCPYVVSTVLMVSLYRGTHSENGQAPPTQAPPTQTEPGSDEDYDDVMAVTTEHQF